MADMRELINEWNANAANLERAGVYAPNYDKGAASAFRQCADNLTSALAAQPAPAAAAVPEGWMLVPREPTQDMLRVLRLGGNIDNRKTYAAMLSAAPQPAAVKDSLTAAQENSDAH